MHLCVANRWEIDPAYDNVMLCNWTYYYYIILRQGNAADGYVKESFTMASFWIWMGRFRSWEMMHGLSWFVKKMNAHFRET